MPDLLSCPKCGSTSLRSKGKRAKESALTWLVCRDCGHRHRWHTAAIVPVTGWASAHTVDGKRVPRV